MRKRIFSIIGLSLLLVMICAVSAFAATTSVLTVTPKTSSITLKTEEQSKDIVLAFTTSGEVTSTNGGLTIAVTDTNLGTAGFKTAISATNPIKTSTTQILQVSAKKKAGESTITIKSGNTTLATINLTVNKPAPVVTTNFSNSQLPAGKVATAYSQIISLDYFYTGDAGAGAGTVTVEPNIASTDYGFTVVAAAGRVTVGGTPKQVMKGQNVKFTFSNGSDDKSTTVKYFRITVAGQAPAFTGTGNYADGGNLSAVVDSTKKIIGPRGVSGTTIDIPVTGTFPMTITAAGLPKGLKLSQDAASLKPSATATLAPTAHAYIVGSPDVSSHITNLVITAKNAEGSATRRYEIETLLLPKITTKALPDLTWDKDYKFTLAATGATTERPVSWSVSPVLTNACLSIDANTGTITGKYASRDAAQTISNDLKFGGAVSKSINYVVTASNAAGAVSASLPLRFKAVKPEIKNLTQAQISIDLKAKLKAGTALPANAYVIYADGPGSLDFSVDNLPAGITATKTASTPSATLGAGITLAGTPKSAVKNHSAKFTVKNGVGAATGTLKFNIGVDSMSIKVLANELKGIGTTGKRIGDTPAVMKLQASTPPVTWSAVNLPKGLSLSYDKNSSDVLEVIGKFTAASTLDKDLKSQKYKITATSTIDKNISAVFSNDMVVYDSPDFKTGEKLPALTIGKVYKATIEAKGISFDWTQANIKIGGTAAGTGFNAGQSNTTMYKLTGSADKTAYNKYIITGSLDRIPPAANLTASGDILVHAEIKTPLNATFTFSKDFLIPIKGEAPKFTTSTIPAIAKGKSADVFATGTMPITISAYLEPAAAKIISPDSTGSIDIGQIPGITFSTRPASGSATITVNPGTNTVVKDLNVTFSAINSASAKPVTKKLKLTIGTPELDWYIGATPAANNIFSKDITRTAVAGKAITSETFTVSGDYPYTITVSPATQNGLTATITKPVVTQNTGAVGTKGNVVISGTPTSGKESKTSFTLTVKNPATGKKASKKVTFQAKMPPVITTQDSALTKETELGKGINLKMGAKGSTPIIWLIKSGSADLKAVGLSLDTKSGTFTGSATGVKSASHAPVAFNVEVYASNDAGSSDVKTVSILVKGKKPKIVTKTITLSKDSPNFTVAAAKLLTEFSSADASADVQWTGTLPLGLSIASSTKNEGILTGTPTQASKGTKATVKASNLGQETTGSVTFVIRDATPVIAASPSALSMQAEESTKVTDTVTFTLSAGSPTGDTKMKWTLSGKPAKPVNASIKEASDGKSATVTVTVDKNVTQGVLTSFTVSVQNQSTKATATSKVDVSVTAVNGALPTKREDETSEEVSEGEEAEAVEETETELEAEVDPALVLGDERTADSLTEGEHSAVIEGGYVIAAVLPEIKATVSGQYDLEVDLDETVSEGAKLYWFAFPRNAAHTTDDDIVEFYDEAGAETEVVPAGHKVVVSPWFREGVTYAPVIAVKAEDARGAKGSVDGAEAGDVVTEEALEAAE